MIFATCGSSHFGFQRMMAALAALDEDEGLHVQHGPASPPPCAEAYDFLSFETLTDKIRAADIVVTHAGVGSVLTALRAGHTPVVFPRLKRYDEAVDDHQAELAEMLAQRGTAILARTPAELREAIASVPVRRSEARTESRALTDAVRATIFGKALRTVPMDLDTALVRVP